MEFSNLPLTPAELPTVENISLTPVSTLYNKVLLYRWLAYCFIVAIIWGAVAFFFREKFSSLVLILVSSGLVFLGLVFRLIFYWSYKFRRYAVRQHDLIAQSGWLVSVMHVCPLNRIQHTAISADLFERKFGLATLTLFTAGNNDSDISLAGLPEETARQLKDLITAYNLPDTLPA